MKIFTSYFANVKNLPPDAILISLACYAPRLWKGREIISLAPAPVVLADYQKNHDEAAYSALFNAALDHKQAAVYKEMFEIISRDHEGNEHPIVLLCYERPQAFCHRHLVAKWLNDNGTPVSEYETKENKSER